MRKARSGISTLVVTLILGSAPGAFAYDFQKPITIDRTKIADASCLATLTDYPMLFSVADPDLRHTGNGGDVTDLGGDDIIFRAFDASTCAGPTDCTLDHEIERYDGTTGELVAWVRLPSVNTTAAASDTVIYIQYGDSAVISPTENPAGVWDANYAAVWHLKETGNGTLNEFGDSTVNANHGQGGSGTAGRVPTRITTGQIGNAQTFDNTNDQVRIASSASLGITGQITVSAWIKRAVTNWSAILTKTDLSSSYDYQFLISTGDRLGLWADGTSQNPINSTTTLTNTTRWHHVSVTRTGTNVVNFYVDGAAVPVCCGGITANAFNNNAVPVMLGYDNEFDSAIGGDLDEVRLSKTARSACWIGASYNNQVWPDKAVTPTPNPSPNPASGFYTVGPAAGVPVLTTTGATSVLAWQLYTLNLAASSCTPTSWTINWGDSSIETFAGNPSSVDHVYTAAGFTYNILASAVCAGTTYLQNELVVASGGNDKVNWYDNAGGFLMARGPDAGLNEPVEAIIGPDGNLYVSGWFSSNVVRYNPTTGAFIDEFVPSGDGGLAQAAGMAFGPDGNLYVSSSASAEVLRYDGTTGTFIGAFVSSGLGGLTSTGGLIFGPDGNLYVNDWTGNSVYRYDGSTGAFIDVFVAVGLGGLTSPEDLVFGPDGNLYVASADTDQVLRYNGRTGAFIDVFASEPAPGPELSFATGVRFGPEGHLYVGSWRTDEVLRFDGTSGAFIDDYVPSGLGGLTNPLYFTFIPEQQITVVAGAAGPTISSAANQSFTVGAPSTPAAIITITDDATLAAITAAKDLRIRIPAGFNMAWDSSISSVTLGGSAASDVSPALLNYESNGRIAVVDVINDFSPGATLTISGLAFDNFVSVSAVDNLELGVLNNGSTSATDDKTKEVVVGAVARIVSEKDQLFWEGDPATLAEPIHITDASTAGITKVNDIRVRIPASLLMTWDSTVTSITVSGSASAKVKTNVSYEDADKTLVVDASVNFANADHVKLSGLRFKNFLESPTDYLQLEVLNDDAVTSTDSSSVTIDPTSKVRVFTAKSTSGENRLEWLNPKSGPYVSTRIVAKDGSPPANPFDGRLVVSQAGGLGATNWFVDTGLVDDTTVHYAAYVDQGGGMFSDVARTTGRPFNDVTGPVRWALSTGATSMAPPGIRFKAGVPTVYVVSNSDVLYSVDGGPGGGAWPSGWKPVELGASSQSRPPVVSFPIGSATNGAALVSSQDGSVYAIDADTGNTVWKNPIAEMVQAAPAGEFIAYLNGDTDLVLVGTRNTLALNTTNALVALNVADGTPAWSFQNLSSQGGDDLRMGIVSGGASVDYVNNRVYFASRQGSAGTPGPSSNTLWCVSFTSSAATLEWAQNIGDVDGSPILYGGVVYVGTVAGDVYAFDTSGPQLWSNTTLGDGPVKGFIFPQFGTSNVLLSTNTKVWSLDVNGLPNTNWPVALPSPSTPLFAWNSSYVVVGAGDAKLYQIDTNNPTLITSVTLGGGVPTVVGAPSLDLKNSLIYIGTEQGIIYAVDFPIP